MRLPVLRLPFLAMALLLPAVGLRAQSPAPVPAPRAKPLKVEARLELAAEYDGNVYLLPTNKKDDLSSPSAAERLSGRYDAMEAASDVITTARAAVSFRGDGIGGRDLTVTPSATYEFYAANAERRNVAADLALEQALRKDGRLRLRAGWTPTYYARNYLADAADANADGDIQAGERVYARGDYSEFGAQADYRHRLAKSTRDHPFGAFLLVGVGFADRTYDAPFTARDQSGPTGDLRLELSPRPGFSLETSYDVALLGSPVTSQVILLDEPVFGEDLNGNGNATDLSARAVRTVDRSHTEHTVGETARIAMGRRTDLEIFAAYRWRAFSSSEPYDVANNGRRDQRVQVGVELRRRVARGLRLLVGSTYGSQRLNRRTDLGGEGAVDDYTKLQAHVGLRLDR